MDIAQLLGLFGGALVTCSLVPQIIRVFRLKSAREISVLFTSLMLLGLLTWLSYGVWLRLGPVILWNAIGAILVAVLLYGKVRYWK